MLIADHDRMAPRYSRGDHWMTLEESRNLEGQFLVTGFGVLAQPGGYIGRQTESGVIRGCDVTNDTVDSANVDGRTGSLRSSREYGTSGVSVGEDKRPSGRMVAGHLAGILGSLMGLSAAGGRFNYH